MIDTRDYLPAMGGYNFTTHAGAAASWVGRGDRGDWLALDPWGRECRGFKTRYEAAEWCERADRSIYYDDNTYGDDEEASAPASDKPWVLAPVDSAVRYRFDSRNEAVAGKVAYCALEQPPA